ncbi:MAG: sulfur carrier protein ThiS [Deltaproteobacteria bacterium]
MIIVDGRQVPWREGMTVATLLREIDDGHLYAVVRLNGKIVARPNFETTSVPEHAEIVLLPLIAGG